jgi:hypothetical protein
MAQKKKLSKDTNKKAKSFVDMATGVDGEVSFETVSGEHSDTSVVKGIAGQRVRERHPDKRIAVILHEKTDLNLDEYEKHIGRTPAWPGGKAAE